MLIIMHGVPGSGKSTLARELAKQYSAVICSADYYFESDNGYVFNPKLLGQAHQSCKDNCRKALEQGSNVIIDNTNLTYKECKPYIEMAIEFKHDCQIISPQTEWKDDAKICSEKNSHGVPEEKIVMMLQKRETITKIWEKVNAEIIHS